MPTFFIDGVRFLGNVDELEQALNDRGNSFRWLLTAR